MRSLIHPRKANQEDIQRSIGLEWNQDPTIAPLTDRFGEAQIEQKPIVDDGKYYMTRGETRNRRGQKNMDERRTRTRACDKEIDEKEEYPHDEGAKPEKDGSHKPGDGRATPAPDHHSYQREHHEPDGRTDNLRIHIIDDTD